MRVVGLWRFPVKSFGGEQLGHAEVGDYGITGDRHWGVQHVETGRILTARREPKLLYASARFVDGRLVVSLPDGDAASDDALSDWLGAPVRLIEARPGVHGTYETPVDYEHENATPWHEWEGPDGVFHDSKRTQVSVVSQSTLRGWDARRFRSNVIVDGAGEDALIGHRISIGSVVLDVVKPVDRCVMTTRPQPGIERDLHVLRSINRERGGNLAVGCLVVSPGRIDLGDELDVVG